LPRMRITSELREVAQVLSTEGAMQTSQEATPLEN